MAGDSKCPPYFIAISGRVTCECTGVDLVAGAECLLGCSFLFTTTRAPGLCAVACRSSVPTEMLEPHGSVVS